MSTATPLEQTLDHLSHADRTIALRYLVHQQVEVGQVLTEQGANDPALAYVCAGRLTLRSNALDICDVGPGETAGAEDVLRDSPRTFSVVAAEPTSFYATDQAGFARLQSVLPEVSRHLELGSLRGLCHALGALDVRISANASTLMRERDPDTRHRFPLLDHVGGHAVDAGAPTSVPNLPLPTLMQNFPALHTARMSPYVHGLRFGPGQTLVRQGEATDGVYILLSGRVEVFRRVSPEIAVHLAGLGANAVVGIRSAMLNETHGATCVAAEEVHALHINQVAWQTLLEMHSPESMTLRVAAICALGNWMPSAREQAECAVRCVRTAIHERIW